ncbi:MAG: hypothetical protein ACREF3_09335, partial [Acetobacteraceae bacterium]
MSKQSFHYGRTGFALLIFTAVAVCLAVSADHAVAFRGGFGGGFHGGGFSGFHGGGGFSGFSHNGGFHGGTPRFGDGGYFDRSSDAGFGRGGFGSIHNSSTFTNRADTFQQSHPEFQHSAGQLQQNRTNEANTLQQNRTNEANTLQSNRYNGARNLQYNRQTTFNN